MRSGVGNIWHGILRQSGQGFQAMVQASHKWLATNGKTLRGPPAKINAFAGFDGEVPLQASAVTLGREFRNNGCR